MPNCADYGRFVPAGVREITLQARLIHLHVDQPDAIVIRCCIVVAMLWLCMKVIGMYQLN